MSRPAVVCVVGPPASGKTLLITSLTEALRQRGHRVATASPRGDAAVVFTLPNGGRATVSRSVPADELAALVASFDPTVTVLLAEGMTGSRLPTVELSPRGGRALMTPAADLLAVVASTEVASDFASFGPGATRGLADMIEERVIEPRNAPQPAPGWRRLFRRKPGRTE